MNVIPTAPLIKFAVLRTKLLNAELSVARLVGRSEDARRLEAELRFLDIYPTDALMLHVRAGKVVAGGRAEASPENLQSQMDAFTRRIVELESEVKEWQATRSRGGR